MMSKRSRSVLLGLCHAWVFITQGKRKNTMKGISRGKNNINYKNLLEILGAGFDQVFCHFLHNTLKQIPLPTKFSTVFRLVVTVLLFVTFRLQFHWTILKGMFSDI